MPYALIPDGYSLKKVTKLQKQAVNEKRRHDDVVAILNNENTPLLVGATAFLAYFPILVALILQLLEDEGITVPEEVKTKLTKTGAAKSGALAGAEFSKLLDKLTPLRSFL